jgi:hypothetical protein
VDKKRTALIENTIKFLQSRNSCALTPEDGRQAIENVTGFFTTLQRWSGVESPMKNGERHQEAA